MNAYRALGCAESATGDGRSGPRHLLGRAALATASLVVSARVVNVVRLRTGVVGTRRYWSIPRGPAGGLLYVALGDSSAQGIGASRPDRGYVGLVAERVRARTGKDVQVINLSVSGARIDDLLEDQLPLLANLEADLVTVTIGGNDVHTYHTGTFAAQVDRLTAALPPGTFIADVPYFMHGHWERDAQQSADVLTRSAVCPWCRSTTRCVGRAGRRCSPSSPPTCSIRTTGVTASGRMPSGAASRTRRHSTSRRLTAEGFG